MGATSLVQRFRSKTSRAAKEQFAAKPLEIIERLQAILGPTGSSVVDRLIVREIRNKFGLEFRENTSLSDAIQQARTKFLNVAD